MIMIESFCWYFGTPSSHCTHMWEVQKLPRGLYLLWLLLMLVTIKISVPGAMARQHLSKFHNEAVSVLLKECFIIIIPL